MLKVERISKSWKEFRIKNISFEVKKGEYFIVLGPSGAGKTLLLELIAGIHFPDEGKIFMDDKDVTDLPPEKRGLSYIPQEIALFPHMNVYDNIAYGLKLRKVSKNEITAKVKEIAEILGISHLLRRKPRTLSGGEQQRVAIARALVVEPNLILLDEPFVNLDVQIKSKLIQEMKVWRRELDFTALHVTHSFEEALSLGDRVGIMLDGKLAQIGEVRQVFTNPRNEEIAKFLGFENIFEGNASGNKFVVNGISIKIPRIGRKGIVKMGVRPDSIIVSRNALNMDNVFKGKIIAFEDLGALVRLMVDVGGVEFKAFITRSSFLEMELKEGKEIFIGFKSSSVHIFD